jgi:hypothetical protein
MSSKEFTAQQFRWLHQINGDAELLKADLSVALQLTRRFDEDDQDGRAYPGYKDICKGTGLSRYVVIHSIRRLEAQGYLRVVWGSVGRGHPNQYWMAEKGRTVRPFEAKEKVEPFDLLRGNKRSSRSTVKGRVVAREKVESLDQNLKENLEENLGARAAADFSGASEEKASAKAEVVAAFGRFWSVFPLRFGKLVGKVGAEKVFAAALKAGTPAEVIVAGASAYARRRAAEIANGDEERWTSEPTNWLRAGKWDEAASGDGGPLLDERGAVTPQRGNGHDDDRGPIGYDDPNYLEKAMGRLFS